MINLGDEVEDIVSGFKGIVVSKHLYLQGCSRISVQQVVDKDGKLPDSHTFDEPQLKCIAAGKVKKQANFYDPGGPEKYMDEGR